MVITRQQNATAEANPSVTKFSKKQNELKMNEVRKFSANTATGQYHLNLHVLGLNYSSTFVEMIKGYRSMGVVPAQYGTIYLVDINETHYWGSK